MIIRAMLAASAMMLALCGNSRAQQVQSDTLLPIAPAVTASAYTANFAMGGLQTVNLFRSWTQPSGILNSVLMASKGGMTTPTVIYGFARAPASTCADHAAFVLSSTDLPYLLPGFPITLTPAALNSTTQTIGSQVVNVSVKNEDTSLLQTLYFCAVTTGTPTPASTSDLVFIYGAVQD